MRIGVIPAMISVVVLPKLGVHHGMRLFLTGETFTAAAARDYGLLHQVVAAADLAGAVQAEIDAIALGGPNAVREAKQLVRTIPRLSMDDGFAYAQDEDRGAVRSAGSRRGHERVRGEAEAGWAEEKP